MKLRTAILFTVFLILAVALVPAMPVSANGFFDVAPCVLPHGSVATNIENYSVDQTLYARVVYYDENWEVCYTYDFTVDPETKIFICMLWPCDPLGGVVGLYLYDTIEHTNWSAWTNYWNPYRLCSGTCP